MTALFDQIFTLLTQSPGNLVYHLVLVFSIALAANAAFSFWNGPAARVAHRLVGGLMGLLALQLLQFFAAALVWQIPGLSSHLLPLLDRLVSLVSLLVIIWLWLIPTPVRAGDASILLAGLAVQIALVLGLVWWNAQAAETAFNNTWLDFAVQALGAGLALLGIVGLLIRRLENWPMGLAMLSLLLAGHLFTFIYQSEGDYLGALRLFQMAAYPLLITLTQRLGSPVVKIGAVSAPEQSEVPDRRRYSLDPKLVGELLALAADTSRERLCQQITRIVGQMMVADYTLLVTPPDNNGQLTAACGYNLIEEKIVDGFSLDGRLTPGITSAMRRNRTLRLPASSSSSDLQALSRQLGLSRSGHLMVVPVAQPGSTPKMGLVVISPYSNRGWSADDQTYLTRVADFLAFVLWRQQTVRSAQSDASEIADRLQSAQKLADEAQAERAQLSSQLDLARQQIMEERSRAESLAAMIAQHETLNSGRDSAAAANPLNADVAAAQEQMELELRQSLTQVTQMRQALADADRRLIEASRHSGGSGFSLAPDIQLLLQELRQPLASISGYADMLQSETIGILGNQQRKFVERIKASVERAVGLADEMISMIDGLSAKLSPVALDLDSLIDDAVSNVIGLLRSKNIVLRVDVPTDLPRLRADRQALLQILGRLLQNAAEITPNHAEILLRARPETRDHEPGYVLIQVADTGGGIPAELLPQVFSRVHATADQPIAGLGASRQGLAETKMLVELHGGRLWVDTIIGQGSTFSALFPVAEQGQD